MHQTIKTNPDDLIQPTAGFCLTGLSTLRLLGCALGVSAMLWLAILIVI